MPLLKLHVIAYVLHVASIWFIVFKTVHYGKCFHVRKTMSINKSCLRLLEHVVWLFYETKW